MEHSWSVVHFLKDRRVEAVPSTWMQVTLSYVAAAYHQSIDKYHFWYIEIVTIITIHYIK